MTQVIVKRRREMSEDELMHAKYIKKDKVNGKWRYYYDYNDGDGWSNKVGVSAKKNADNSTTVSAFNTKNTKYWDKHQKTSKKNYGPVTVSKAEDGVEYKVTLPSKQKIEKVTKKTVKQAKKQINKGKKYLSKLFG